MRLAPWQEDEMLTGEYDVSVLFADLTGFSTLAENWSAAEVVRMLNLVFERWTADVFERDGTLDKYIGDAVMAVFGAPLRQADHAQRALATALAMQRTLDDLNRLRPQEVPLQLRIGINSGRVTAGDIGSPRHKSYTVIGDVVNIASRLETSVALPGQIVIGQATYEQIREQYACEPLGKIQLRGKRQAIRAYRVIGVRKEGPGAGTRGLGSIFKPSPPQIPKPLPKQRKKREMEARLKKLERLNKVLFAGLPWPCCRGSSGRQKRSPT